MISEPLATVHQNYTTSQAFGGTLITETPRQPTLTPLHSASQFKSKYIVFRDTKKNKKIKENRIYSTITTTTPNSDILKTKKREIKENIIYTPITIIIPN